MSKFNCKNCIYREDRESAMDYKGDDIIICDHEDWTDIGDGETACFGFMTQEDMNDYCTYCKYWNDGDCNNDKCYKMDMFVRC